MALEGFAGLPGLLPTSLHIFLRAREDGVEPSEQLSHVVLALEKVLESFRLLAPHGLPPSLPSMPQWDDTYCVWMRWGRPAKAASSDHTEAPSAIFWAAERSRGAASAVWPQWCLGGLMIVRFTCYLWPRRWRRVDISATS